MSLRSSRSPRRSLSDDKRDDQREEIREGLNMIWRLLTEALSKLNELVSNSASQSVVVESNPGFRNSEAVAYVQPRIMFLSSALHSLVFPVFLAISFQWYFVGPMKRSQRLAAKPLVSYSLVNRRWQRRSDHESKHRIRTRKLLAPPTSLSRLQPRPSSPIMEERREGFPDRLKGVTTLHTIRN